MGTVYRAADQRTGRAVALKLVRAEYATDPLFRARFERELRLMRQLSHPNILPVLDAGELDKVLFVAMPVVEGTDLEAVLVEQGSLHPAHAADLIAQVASALDVAGDLGLVHRDVKPGNVLLERRDSNTHAYLGDFGLGKHVASKSGLTSPGTWVGSVDYASPEQIQGQSVDRRTDVYALGAVLYQALTGEVPFPRARDVDKLLAHLSTSPPRPSTAGASVPQELDTVVARAMAKEPAERYERAGDLAAATQAATAASCESPKQPLLVAQLDRTRPIDRGAPTVG